jgi:acetyl-CoA carboxylase biotin carboxyl carrier protein
VLAGLEGGLWETASLMNIKEIKELIEAVCQNGITELEIERAGVKVRIRRDMSPPVSGTSSVSARGLPVSQITQPASAAKEGSAIAKPQAESGGSVEDELVIVRSPIVGTFYRASNPDTEAFVKLGDAVESGQVLCIIEAMKLMNEIESEVSGEVAKIFVENGEPVEFGQSLFGIRPTKKS